MSVRRFALVAFLTVLYFAAGRLGLSLAFVNQSASPVWPPTGLAIAACLLGGNRLWPGVFLGALLVNLTTTGVWLPSLLIACGNTCEALIAASLARRVAPPRELFTRTSGTLRYVGIVLLATCVAASVGTLALLAGNLAGSAPLAMIWMTWWTGDLSSAILIAPAILTCARRPEEPITARAVLEAGAVLTTLAAAAYVVFGPSPAGVRGYPLMFVTLPVLLWAALRFGLPGAALAMFVTAAIATIGTLNGLGPFARSTANESLLLLVAYLGVKMVVMLTLAAEVSARRRVEREMRQLNLDLEQRIAERSEDLQRLHGRLVEAQHVAHIGSWEWDVAANSIWWSDEMYRLYGLPVGSPITYERFMAMVHPDDRARVHGVVSASVRTAEPFTFEHRAIKSDGAVLTLYSRGRVVTDAEGRTVRMLGIGHDITDRRRAEEERVELVREQAARREAEEASRMKDYFLATLSHELRTPINALSGWAQVLRKTSADGELRDRALTAILRNVTIQAQLVSDILDVSRIRSGAVSIDAQPVTVQAIVDGALDIMTHVLEEKGIEVVADIPAGVAVHGDARRLQQVCWNILSNAAKFLQRGGRISIAARQENGDVELRIEDNGPGMSEDFLPHVFEQFRQEDSSLTRQHGGLGLGLTISRDLVQLHGGTIAAANRPEGGAIFTVRLPAAARATV